MSTDPKAATPPPSPKNQPLKIFTYPKIIFIWPTFVTAVICAIGMSFIGDDTVDPKYKPATSHAADPGTKAPVEKDAKSTTAEDRPVYRFSSPNNVFGMVFVTVFFLNLLIMSVDFPRFTIIAIILVAVAVTFFLLWLNIQFRVIPVVIRVLEKIFAVANSGFYALFATAILFNFGIIFFTRYLDYWQILPNEILHNHGPFSDLERFPTTNLKFDKEIPDILEYLLLRSGRLVLHIQNERKAIVLDNVLFIDRKEDRLKQLMSRMEVRITTDQEADQPI